MQQLKRLIASAWIGILLYSGAGTARLWADVRQLPETRPPALGLLVKFKAGQSLQTMQQEARRLGLAAVSASAVQSAVLANVKAVAQARNPTLGIEHVMLPAGADPGVVMQQLQKSALVEYVEPNYLLYALAPLAAGPNDLEYQSGHQWWLEAIQADRVWQEGLLPTGPMVVVAVLDSGVRASHEDLAGVLVTGYDFITSGGTCQDNSGHGTHVAGIVGAMANNLKGIAGTAMSSAVKIMPVKVMEKQGESVVGSIYNIAQGVIWAVQHGARVINLSLGNDFDSRTLEEAIVYAYSHGVVVVAAAGNDALNGNPMVYPAAYPQVIAVGACNSVGARAAYSEYQAYVDLVAPGGDFGPEEGWIMSLFNTSDSDYQYDIGTSMAAPVVSGVAALLLVQDSSRTPEEIKNIMTATAGKTSLLLGNASGWNPELGWGEVNLYQALKKNTSYTNSSAGHTSFNYPNPFKPNQGEKTYVVIPAEAVAGQSAVLTIYDAMGRLVWKTTLSGQAVYPGAIIGWEGRNLNQDPLANGVYPYRLEMGSKVYLNKIAVMN